MPGFIDDELGEFIVRKSRTASNIRIRYLASGKYSVSAPAMTPLIYIKNIVKKSRRELFNMRPVSLGLTYVDGQSVGKSHQIAVVSSGLSSSPKVKVIRKKIVVTLPPTIELSSKAVQELVRQEVVAVLRKEAKAYLPNRLSELAKKGAFHYERVRFSHASGRWGSCSSSGTISLNIALMKLPDILIDYVLIHELSHTIEMNHSSRFWEIVATYDPLYKSHRTLLKRETPHI